MGGVDKILTPLLGRPLLAWPLRACSLCEDIEGIVVVAAASTIERVRTLIKDWRFDRVKAVVEGGASRQDSVRAGIEAAEGARIVAVHDAARPLVTPELFSEGIALAREAGAAICAVRARDTVKDVVGDLPVVRATMDRSRTWLAQTPQVFERELLLEAHRQAEPSATDDPVAVAGAINRALAAHSRAEGAATDDAALVEATGHAVRVYEGGAWNLKVTEPEDLLAAEALLRARFGR